MKKLVLAVFLVLASLASAPIYACDDCSDIHVHVISIDEDGVYVIEGRWIEHVFNSVNLGDSESSQYFQRLLRTKGVIDELERMGIQEEDTVRIADTEFDFVF